MRPGHVLIKVLATGVNRLDHYIREGSVAPDLPLPHILGSDASGEIAEIGNGVQGFEVGERVIPLPGYPLKEEDNGIRPIVTAPSFVLPGLHIWGAYAQYMEVPAHGLVKDRTGLKPEEVATLPVPLATGVRAVKKVGGVEAGNKVLIQAGASGSGSLQIQVARALGARVAATVRDDAKGEYVKSIGAELVINTRKEDLVGRIKEWTDGQGVDVVIDGLGGSLIPQSIDAVKPLGKVVAFGFAAGTEVTFDIRNFPSLDRVLPLNQAAEAHRLISANKVKGTIALLPWVA